MEKQPVKLNKEQFGLMNLFKQQISYQEVSEATIIEEFVSGCLDWNDDARNIARTITLDILITALYIGYELEQSPEDQILAMYNLYLDAKNSGDYDRIPEGSTGTVVIEEMLSILKMEVPGINTKF